MIDGDDYIPDETDFADEGGPRPTELYIKGPVSVKRLWAGMKFLGSCMLRFDNKTIELREVPRRSYINDPDSHAHSYVAASVNGVHVPTKDIRPFFKSRLAAGSVVLELHQEASGDCPGLIYLDQYEPVKRIGVHWMDRRGNITVFGNSLLKVHGEKTAGGDA